LQRACLAFALGWGISGSPMWNTWEQESHVFKHYIFFFISLFIEFLTLRCATGVFLPMSTWSGFATKISAAHRSNLSLRDLSSAVAMRRAARLAFDKKTGAFVFTQSLFRTSTLCVAYFVSHLRLFIPHLRNRPHECCHYSAAGSSLPLPRLASHLAFLLGGGYHLGKCSSPNVTVAQRKTFVVALGQVRSCFFSVIERILFELTEKI